MCTQCVEPASDAHATCIARAYVWLMWAVSNPCYLVYVTKNAMFGKVSAHGSSSMLMRIILDDYMKWSMKWRCRRGPLVICIFSWLRIHSTLHEDSKYSRGESGVTVWSLATVVLSSWVQTNFVVTLAVHIRKVGEEWCVASVGSGSW